MNAAEMITDSGFDVVELRIAMMIVDKRDIYSKTANSNLE
jgi:hypothetical protein